MQIFKSAAARVGIFVDMQNIHRSSEQHSPARLRLNFKEFLNVCLANRTLYCARIYDVTTEDFSRTPLFQAMENADFEVLTKPVQVFTGGVMKGDWDVGMVVDMITLSEKLDVVVLASGDGDFLPAVTYLKHKANCRVEGISFMRNTNTQLHAALDSHIDLGALTSTNLFFKGSKHGR